MLKNVVLLVCIVTLVSCVEKETTYEYSIENNSSSVISFQGNSRINSSTIAPQSSRVVAVHSDRGKTEKLLSPVIVLGDSLLIVNTHEDTLNKDYSDMSNWQTRIEEKRRSVFQSYTLKIVESDF